MNFFIDVREAASSPQPSPPKEEREKPPRLFRGARCERNREILSLTPSTLHGRGEWEFFGCDVAGFEMRLRNWTSAIEAMPATRNPRITLPQTRPYSGNVREPVQRPGPPNLLREFDQRVCPSVNGALGS